MSESSDAKIPSGLVDAGTITSILVPLLYTSGWSFAYHYFEHFHIGLIGLEIPKEHLFLYSFWVIKGRIFLFLAALLLTVLAYFGIRFCFRQAKDRFRAIGLFLTPVFILFLFCVFYQLGDYTAKSLYEKQAERDFPSYPGIRVWLNKDAAKEAGPVAEEWARGCYRLLLRNKDNLFIFYASGYSEKIATEIIPRSKVRSMRILPLYQSTSECDS